MTGPDRSGRWRDLCLLAVVFGVLFSVALGRAELGNPDEGRYAEIPREMVASGDWVTPRLNGVAYFEKPPLVYWLVAICQVAFGPGEWALRITPVGFAVLGVVLTYLMVRRLSTRPAAVIAAGVLGTSLFYFAIGRLLLLDMVVSVLITATLGCFIAGVREPPGPRRRAMFYGLYVSASLATLSKGLIGFLLPGAVMFLWLLVFNQWQRLRPFYLPTGLLLFAVVAVPWHVLAAQRNPTWAHFYFVHEHWERFTTATHGRVRPWWFFVPLVVFGFWPWTGFFPGALRAAVGRWRERAQNSDAWFLVVWAGFIFAFFSLSHSKLPPYVLPVFPPLAALAGIGVARQIEGGQARELRWAIDAAAGLGGLLAIALVGAVMWPALVKLDETQTMNLRPLAAVMAAILTIGSGSAIALVRSRGFRAAVGAVFLTAAVFLAVLGFATADIQPGGTAELARFVKTRLPPAASVYHYHDFFHDFTYYAGRFVGTVEFHGDELELLNDRAAQASGRFIDEDTFRDRWHGPELVFVVVRKKTLRELQGRFGAHIDSGMPERASPPQRVPVLVDPRSEPHLVRETADYALLSNRVLPR